MTQIPVQALAAELDAGARPHILDVRSAAEYQAGHVRGAVHIPFWMLPLRLDEVPAGRDERLIVYCGHGPRATLARAVLTRAGFSNVATLEGHWAAWTAAQLPIER